MQIRDASPGIAAALRKLASDGDTEAGLVALLSDAHDSQALPALCFHLEEFSRNRMLCRSVYAGRKPLATLVPISQQFRFERCVDAAARYVLSRFACLRRSGCDLILESPLSHAMLVLHDQRCATLIGDLREPRRCQDLAGKERGITPKIAHLFFELLHNAGALSEVNESGESMEDKNPALLQWEFHDLLFHSRSRAGRHSNPYGRTDHFVGKVVPPAVVKSKMSIDITDLYKPDIDRLRDQDVPFTRVLEDRKSQRGHGKSAITHRELGELLYRSARVRTIHDVDGFRYTNRVYPGSGAAYELELYPVVNRCAGIRPGLYHYDPLYHQLSRLSGRTRDVERLLKSAAATAHAGLPQVLIIVSARFQRVTWRYASIGYAAILKDVGVLYQTMYLVATAMGLSACALGVGDSDLFAAAAGTNYYCETSVGEFILGRGSSSVSRKSIAQ